jgi:tetratricopeptide (TPR) repeat protein
LLLTSAPVAAADSPVDEYWRAQRLELSGQPGEALKRYGSLIAKVPTSAVAADRLLATALLRGDMKASLRAIRAQQLAEAADADSPLLLFVDAWRRSDWKGVDAAINDLEARNNFAFVAPLLKAWKNVSLGKDSGITTAMLRADPLLGFYTMDQLVYLDLAQGNNASAKERLTRMNGFSEDFGRHVALTAAGQLAATGDIQFATTLLSHIGTQADLLSLKPARLSAKQLADTALAAHFARLSDQLETQSAGPQALYFARLALWVAPTSEFAKMTLAKRLDAAKDSPAADALFGAISPQSLQWSWAMREHATMLNGRGDKAGALALVRKARAKAPAADDLSLLEAQLLDDAGRQPEAIAVYRTIIAAADARATAPRQRAMYRILLAQALEKTGDWTAARKQLENALSFDGNNPQLLNYLGYSMLERREDIKRGFEHVSKAHSLSPNSPEITDSLGWGHFLSGQYNNAVPLLEKAVETAIADVTINEHLGDAYWKTGRKIDARYAWKAALLVAKNGAANRISSKIDIGLNESNASP